MNEHEWLAERFQQHRPRLRAVAFRMLGSGTEADDAVQEAWLRLSGTDADEIDNLEAWLVTVVGRVALNMLRSRRTRREDPLEERLPDPVDRTAVADPEEQAVLADSVGLALLVILETLTPAERLAYVLHDMFSVPFEEIGTILDRSPEAARQLASRARRRIRTGNPTTAEADVITQRRVVEAFLAAARDGDFEGLVAVLDPAAEVREDTGAGLQLAAAGAENVARRARSVSRQGIEAFPAMVGGTVGFVSFLHGDLYAIAALTHRDGRIAALDVVTDSARLADLDYALLDFLEN